MGIVVTSSGRGRRDPDRVLVRDQARALRARAGADAEAVSRAVEMLGAAKPPTAACSAHPRPVRVVVPRGGGRAERRCGAGRAGRCSPGGGDQVGSDVFALVGRRMEPAASLSTARACRRRDRAVHRRTSQRGSSTTCTRRAAPAAASTDRQRQRGGYKGAPASARRTSTSTRGSFLLEELLARAEGASPSAT